MRILVVIRPGSPWIKAGLEDHQITVGPEHQMYCRGRLCTLDANIGSELMNPTRPSRDAPSGPICIACSRVLGQRGLSRNRATYFRIKRAGNQVGRGATMTLQVVSQSRCFDGTQFTYQHESSETGTMMRFAAFVPPDTRRSPFPIVWYLSGLTCTEENFIVKAGAQRVAAELGLLLIAPDTSPRGDAVPRDPAGSYDFGLGAGFYVDATQEPWLRNYRMASYIECELPALVISELPAAGERQSIMGHSMGGHGALTVALRNQSRYASVSAFSPICSPMNCQWGQKALSGYLGSNKEDWRRYDTCALLEDGARLTELLVDQGTADQFLETQLKPELLKGACARAGVRLNLRMQEGYDHSYFFISTFIEDHLRWHAQRLGSPTA